MNISIILGLFFFPGIPILVIVSFLIIGFPQSWFHKERNSRSTIGTSVGYSPR